MRLLIILTFQLIKMSLITVIIELRHKIFYGFFIREIFSTYLFSSFCAFTVSYIFPSLIFKKHYSQPMRKMLKYFMCNLTIQNKNARSRRVIGAPFGLSLQRSQSTSTMFFIQSKFQTGGDWKLRCLANGMELPTI